MMRSLEQIVADNARAYQKWINSHDSAEQPPPNARKAIQEAEALLREVEQAFVPVYGPGESGTRVELAARFREWLARSTPAEALPLDERPCEVTCCDNQRMRHVHEGTHEDHVGDGKWCIDCDVVIGKAGENGSRSTPAEALDVERLAEAIANVYIAPSGSRLMDAENVATEYARLSPHNREAGEPQKEERK